MGRAPDPPPLPWGIRLLALGGRALHRITGGRFGSTESAKSVPRGRALRLVAAVHLRLYRWTNGVIGASTTGMPTLLLTTTGRKSGLARTVPLPYFPHPEGVMVVASFAGAPQNPAWYENLVANRDVFVQIRARRYRAIATVASPDERLALWASIVAASANYADYQHVTTREIPVVVLRAT
jgi:deazaflavin-dependent oxidoreductase (nitroreductase family)